MEKFDSIDLTSLKTKRILITGANGFIGHNLADVLCKAGADVYGTSRIERTSNRKNFTWITGTFEDFDTTKYLLEKIRPQIIYHLAGEVTAANDIKYVQGTFHSLVTSTVNILTYATKTGCERIVVTGSCTEPVDQTQSPNSPYSAAKWTVCAYANMFWQCYQTPVVIVRPFVGYGPGQSAGKLIPYVILSLLKKESPALTSGNWLSDWIYIDDIVQGMIAATITPGIEGCTVDLGTGVLTSVRKVVETIDKIIGSEGTPSFGALPDRNNEQTRVADTEFAFSILNWRARIPLEKGLNQTIDAYKKMHTQT